MTNGSYSPKKVQKLAEEYVSQIPPNLLNQYIQEIGWRTQRERHPPNGRIPAIITLFKGGNIKKGTAKLFGRYQKEACKATDTPILFINLPSELSNGTEIPLERLRKPIITQSGIVRHESDVPYEKSYGPYKQIYPKS